MGTRVQFRHGSTEQVRGPRANLPAARQAALRLAICLLMVPLGIGCAAIHPLHGTPADQFGMEERALDRSGRDTIDLALLGQSTPPEHIVDTGDTLGIFVDGILGACQCEQLPVYHPTERDLAPSTGFPIQVRSNGTISLPMSNPLYVRGMTLPQVEELIRRNYTVDQPLLQTGRERILVSLQKPRLYRVIVIRQEAGNGQGNMGASDEGQTSREKRGTGKVVLLPAYRNDVLNALTETGGLPGLDARNTIYVIRRGGTAAGCAAPPSPTMASAQTARRSPRSHIQLTSGTDDWGHSDDETQPAASAQQSEYAGYGNDYGTGGSTWSAAMSWGDPTIRNPRVTKIPMRLAPSEPACFGPQDVMLNDGDIVFIESREPDYFYTGGLLGTGQFELPRDYDVDILDAISIAEGRRARMTFQYPPNKAIGGVSVLNQDVTVGASKVIIQRTLPNGCLANIEVDLHRALRDPHERIMVRPGDRLILRYTCVEACGAYFERQIIDGLVSGLSQGIIQRN